MQIKPQIIIHGPSCVCDERHDWAVRWESGGWAAVNISGLCPLPASAKFEVGRIGVAVASGGHQVADRCLLPEEVVPVLARLCAALMAAYDAGHPALHSQRGPVRSPVAWQSGGKGADSTLLAGYVPGVLPADCPPWELPESWWDALAEARQLPRNPR